MSVYYASVGYTSTPETRQEIPVGGNHPLKFPRDEQNDPWGMHPHRQPDGHVVEDFLTDPVSAILHMPADGLATIQVDTTWDDGSYNRRTYVIGGDDQPYENVGPAAPADPTSWTSLMHVAVGEQLAVLIGHDSDTPRQLMAARIQVALADDVVVPGVRPVRVRRGTTPADNEGPRE